MTSKQNRVMLAFIVVVSILAAIVTFRNEVPLLGDTRAHLGLDIVGGLRVVLRAKKEDLKGKPWTAENLESVRKILENRVNGTGVSEPVIITKPDDQVIIELPGLKDKEKLLGVIGDTASLQFYLIPQLDNRQWTVSGEDPVTKAKVETIVDGATGKPVPPELLDALVFSRDPIVGGVNLLPNSRAVPDPASPGRSEIEFEFDAEGSRICEETTRSHIGKFLCIFLDKKLLTAATINSVIPGKGVITGSFTLEQAKEVSDQLNAGALPVGLEKVEVRDLEATLGRDAVAATTRAGIIGLVLVLLFMIWRYRLPGVLACVSLMLYTMFSLAVFKGGLRWIGIDPLTLTLPGIAGFILSIGMAVDANILIFERLKEELRSGKTLRASIDAGFKRAFTAILDSNVCTVMTCAVLFQFGTGPIRGFALTLGLGVLISMFTAITVTRTFLFALVSLAPAQNPTLYGVSGEAKIPHLRAMQGSRKFMWLGGSAVVIALGMIAWAMGGIKQSIDFRGGTEMAFPFATHHNVAEIERVLVGVNPAFKDSHVVVSSDAPDKPQVAYITTRTLDEKTERPAVQEAMLTKVGPLYPGAGVSYSNVSGTISKELTRNAILAVLFASVLIVLYLAFRFSIGGVGEGLKYGICAVIALLHDVLVLWGAFAIAGKLFGWQVDSLFVTAMLTVIGFSVHDTIIVFDRIRENLQRRQKGESFSDLTDRSIDQTITRSIYTSFTVVLTLLALFFFGGAIIHQFVGALLIGIISGTYSSIFNASVLLVLWKQRDQTYALTGLAAKTGLGARPSSLSPGDRPLVTPRPATQTAGGDINGDANSESETPRDPRPAARRQPVRRRRM